MKQFFTSFLLIGLFSTINLSAQDTLKISYQDFVEKALQNSGQIKHEKQNVALAENRIDQAKSSRFLPNLRLDSQHGLVPGVKSNDDTLQPHEYYLDPDLRNDWEDWAVFTRFQITAAQPIFTWGAIKTAIKAAKLGAEAANFGL